MSVQIGSPRIPSENGNALWKGNKENGRFNQCECCPYGYHIDLDFVRFCEVVSRRNDASASKERRKERRRQRQSMEVLLGLTSPTLWSLEQQLPQIPQEVVGANEATPDPSPPSHRLLVQDALHRAVQDFEDTLERTHKTPPNHLPLESQPDVFFDQHHHQQHRQYHHHQAAGSGETSVSSLSSPVTPQDVVGQHAMSTMSTTAAHEALLQEFDVASIGSANSGLSHGALQNIRHQMALSLERMRELEEQVKLIPILQVQLSVAKEQKRKLKHGPQRELAAEQERSSDGVLGPARPPSPGQHPRAHGEEPTDTFAHAEDRVFANESTTSRKPNAVSGNGSSTKVATRDVGLTCTVMKRDIDTMHRPMTRNAATTTDDLSTSACRQSISLDSMTTAGPREEPDKLYTESEVKKMVKEAVNIYREEFERKRKATQADNRTASLHIVERRDHGVQVASAAWCQEVGVQTSAEAKRVADQGVQAKPRATGVGVDATVKTRTFGTQRCFVCAKCDVEKRSVGCGSADVNEYDRAETAALEEAIVRSVDVRSVKCNTIPLTCADKSTDVSELRGVSRDVSTLTTKLKSVDVCVGTNSTSSNGSRSGKAVDNEARVCDACETRSPRVADISTAECNRTGDTGKIVSPDQESKIPRRTCTGTIENPNRMFKRQTTYTKLASPKVVDLKDITANGTTTPSTLDRIKPLPSPLQSNHGDAEDCASTRLSASSESSSHDQSPLKSIRTNDSPSPSSTLRTSTPKKSSTVELGESSTSSRYEVGGSSRNQVASNSSHQYHVSGPSPKKSPVDYSVFHESSGKLDNAEEVQGLVAKVHLLETDEEIRTKVKPSKKMQAALKVVNDSLKKSPAGSASVGKAASDIIQGEWFQISSTPSANPHVVEDYLDAIEEVSSSLLEHVVNITDRAGNTAMHYALSQGNFDVVSILLDSKVCNINRPNAAGYTAVMLVSLAQVRSQTHKRVLQRFLADADVNIRAKQHGQTALMLAVSHNRLDMVQLLIEGGADLNIQDEDGSTALMCAAEHGHAAIVQFLINQPDADQNIKDVDGSTALDIALEAGHKDVGILLYAHKHFSRNNSPHSSLRTRRSKSTTPTTRSSSTPPRTPSSPLPRTSQE